MKAAQADLDNAELTFHRVQDLRTQKVVSPQELDNARAALDVATAKWPRRSRTSLRPRQR